MCKAAVLACFVLAFLVRSVSIVLLAMIFLTSKLTVDLRKFEVNQISSFFSIVSNGDFANKIGTYQLAIVAKHHNVPFYVVAPVTSFDFHLSRGQEIVIEERKAEEVTHVLGQRLAAEGTEKRRGRSRKPDGLGCIIRVMFPFFLSCVKTQFLLI